MNLFFNLDGVLSPSKACESTKLTEGARSTRTQNCTVRGKSADIRHASWATIAAWDHQKTSASILQAGPVDSFAKQALFRRSSSAFNLFTSRFYRVISSWSGFISPGRDTRSPDRRELLYPFPRLRRMYAEVFRRRPLGRAPILERRTVSRLNSGMNFHLCMPPSSRIKHLTRRLRSRGSFRAD
jgi:hypothetical protein